MKKIYLILIALIVVSCGKEEIERPETMLEDLPPDVGGTHLQVLHQTTSSPYGFYIYLPSSYDEDDELEFPLLVFLHGSGERGNSSTNSEDLKLVLVNGPPKMIENGAWNPTYPMIVVSPQADNYWNPDLVHKLIEYLKDNYKINKRRVYLTGLSMGGIGVLDYIGRYGSDSYATAIVPICAKGKTEEADSFVNMPTWMFHGAKDPSVAVSYSIDMAEAINESSPTVKAKLTIYPDGYHTIWDMTYDGTGMGQESEDYDPFDIEIYDWMLENRRE